MVGGPPGSGKRSATADWEVWLDRYVERSPELDREAGFAEARQVFVDPTDFFRLFRFEA